MATRIGINGFGRIGRQVLRAVRERHGGAVEVVAVNDLTDTRTNAHLFKYDSSYGIYPGSVEAREDGMAIDGDLVKVFSERDPGAIPWKSVGVDLVVESTGIFTNAQRASAHITGGGARKVIISAPATNEDITLVLGVNGDKYDPKQHNVVSNASCTTNCVAPIAKVLFQRLGMTRSLMSTIHSYTNDQKILDQTHSDIRRARSAAVSIIPTTTGAARAVALVIPELAGKIHGLAYRVPTPTVSVVDLVADVDRDLDVDMVNDAFREAARTDLKGILDVCDEELVSVDFKGNPFSSIVDSPSTIVVDKRMVKVLSWYDNEWGYSCRVADLTAFMAERGF